MVSIAVAAQIIVSPQVVVPTAKPLTPSAPNPFTYTNNPSTVCDGTAIIHPGELYSINHA